MFSSADGFRKDGAFVCRWLSKGRGSAGRMASERTGLGGQAACAHLPNRALEGSSRWAAGTCQKSWLPAHAKGPLGGEVRGCWRQRTRSAAKTDGRGTLRPSPPASLTTIFVFVLVLENSIRCQMFSAFELGKPMRGDPCFFWGDVWGDHSFVPVN